MDWTKEDYKLVKIFDFVDFKSALEFVNQVGNISDEMNHHPEINLTWGKVIIYLTTHDQENKVTEKDLILTQKIDELVVKEN